MSRAVRARVAAAKYALCGQDERCCANLSAIQSAALLEQLTREQTSYSSSEKADALQLLLTVPWATADRDRLVAALTTSSAPAGRKDRRLQQELLSLDYFTEQGVGFLAERWGEFASEAHRHSGEAAGVDLRFADGAILQDVVFFVALD